ncbi:MAG TPA: efflux RND transporter periplasmic adaptor subunit [Polyangiaceae bacterium]|nr:efflux RND transporter periplasmic adaptor subunit [Polyangiaceae bacterium]
MTLSRALLAGFGGVLLAAACNHAPREAPKPPDPAIHVETAVAEERQVPELVTITGTLDADQRTDLAANASGRVKKTFVERGQHVKAGDIIAELDARTAVLSATEARANAVSARDQLALNRADCARYTVLLSQHAITQQEFDRAATQCRTQESAAQAASARAAQASKVVGDSTIRAPFAGVVSERFVNVGDYVRDDSKVATVLVDNPLRLRLTVPEANIAAAHAGVVVTFDSVALSGQAFSATIRYVGREIRENSRDLVVEAIADNTAGLLVPGMFVTAHLPTGTRAEPVIPRKAVVDNDSAHSVFVVVNNHLEQRVVQTGAVLGDDIAIPDGLAKGERVVTNPSNQTVDGVRVE